MDEYEYHLFDELRSRRLSRRGFLVRASVMGIALPTVGAILAACGQGGSTAARQRPVGPPRPGGTATWRSPGRPRSSTRSRCTTRAVRPPRRSPVSTSGFPRADYTLDPRLAVSWSAKSPDAWTFVLRQGVSWHDGSPFSADDVSLR